MPQRPRVHAWLALVIACSAGPVCAQVPVTSTPAQEVSRREARDTAAQSIAQQLPQPAAVSVTDLFSQFRQSFEAHRYEEAAKLAQQVLELTEKQAKSPQDEDVQIALINLALAQQLSGDYTGAEASYLRIIDAAEKSGAPLTQRLARANAGLAAAYHADKRYEAAVERFEKAIGLSRRNDGLLNKAQVPLLEKYADSLTQLGRYQDALQAQRYIYRVETRNLAENDPRMAQPLERMGRWLASVGAYDASRRELRRAIALVTAAEGENSVNLVGPLMALADCDRRQLFDPNRIEAVVPDETRASAFAADPFVPPPVSVSMLGSETERSLLRAAELADSRKEPKYSEIADVRTLTGDWYQLRGQPDRALPHYKLAWDAASHVTEQVAGKSLVAALFGAPLLLHYVPPEGWNRYAARKPGSVEYRMATAQLTVDETGQPRDIKLVDDSGDARRGHKTELAIATARYRPRLEAGRPVATTAVSFTQAWTLPVDTQPETAEAPADAKQPAASPAVTPPTAPDAAPAASPAVAPAAAPDAAPAPPASDAAGKQTQTSH